MPPRLSLKLLHLAAIFAATIPLNTLALERAGSSAAVRGQVARANEEHPVGLQIASGEPIYLADGITSGPDSGMQIMLLDQTTFTIGPNSFVRIDEFVYDPKSGVGKVTASLGKGVFRFVTGKIAQANPSNMTVKLPVATIGIRGTMVYGRSDENRAVVGLAGAGPDNNTGDKPAGIDVITPEGTAKIRRPGWGAIVERGKPPVVQQLPKPAIDGILSDVAPRDVTNAPALGGANTAAQQAEKPTTKTSGAGSATSANAASGQSTASALPSLGTFAMLGEDVSRFNGPSLFAAQNVATGPTFADGITLAGQLQSVPSGIATYSQTGVPLIGMAVAGVGSYDFSLTINFATKNVAIAWTNINFPGLATNNSLFGGIGYGNLAPGVAEIIGTSGNCGVDNCQGDLVVRNANGILAKQAIQSFSLVPIGGGPADAAGGPSTAIRH